jgi:hypothetical protein
MPPVGLPKAEKSLASATLLCGVFLAALAGGCALAGRLLPFPDIPAVGAKIEHLSRHGDDYDVLFVGSSRVYQQIVPAVFDRVAAQNGVPVKSFNAGIAGMMSPESGYLVEAILRLPHRRLRWVIFEATPLETETRGANTSRFAYWHDGTRFGFVIRALWEEAVVQLRAQPRAGFSARCQVWTAFAGHAWVHFHGWLLRQSNINGGVDVLNRWAKSPGSSVSPRKVLGERGDGWVPADKRYQVMALDVRAKYEESYRARLSTPAARDLGYPACQSALQQSIASMTQSGLRPILFIPPMTVERNFFPDEEIEQKVSVFDFSDVRRFPELYAPEHRTDIGHVNSAGAEALSAILAQRFVDLVSASAPTRPISRQ